jgi:hypothetical protein
MDKSDGRGIAEGIEIGVPIGLMLDKPHPASRSTS